MFDRPVESLAGVGPKVAERLAKLGVRTLGDLLCLLPQRYEDRTAIKPIGSLAVGEKALVEGVVELSEVAYRRRRSLLARVVDGTGALTLRFFYFNRSVEQALARGRRVRCYGEVRSGPAGLEMVHPEHRAVSEDDAEPSDSLTPVYPTTEGLYQQTLRRIVARALAALEHETLEDYLAPTLACQVLDGAPWPSLAAALSFLHSPPRDAATDLLLSGRHPCSRRIALEELVAQRLSLRRAAAATRTERARPLPAPAAQLAAFRAALPFELTRAQAAAFDEIVADLRRDTPMNRLLQGDVGSGKTVVAAMAALVAAAADCQTAVMAPTELLAEQHFASFDRWLRPLGLEVAALIGAQPARARAATLAAVADGRASVVVGTHALFQESVAFRQLALVIVDEQHRFGVEQRRALKQKGTDEARVPHQLIMTATPIPRTLAMTAYADLDCSVIGELPAGRQPVQTAVLPEQRRAELVQRVAAHCAAGQQAYWVCPLIEESELVDSRAASALHGELAEALPNARVGLVHGRMKAAEKDAVMRAFKAGELELLVATTVIEVGVDVPNATLMVVENAERMGLAQLHQLRGRVGRGAKASTCVLLYRAPLSELARQRLGVLRETNDGFAVAQKDLELRGPGEVLGTRQTGIMQLRIADLLRDADLLPQVIEISEHLLATEPKSVDALIRRWIRGEAEYAKV
ncbi:MAG TPA: ATP-dependent DNA helicase RecG [Gammaproteobacteria bacterium]